MTEVQEFSTDCAGTQNLPRHSFNRPPEVNGPDRPLTFIGFYEVADLT